MNNLMKETERQEPCWRVRVLPDPPEQNPRTLLPSPPPHKTGDEAHRQMHSAGLGLDFQHTKRCVTHRIAVSS